MGNYIRFDWMIKRLLRDKILEKNTRQFDESGTVGTEHCKNRYDFYCLQIFCVKFS